MSWSADAVSAKNSIANTKTTIATTGLARSGTLLLQATRLAGLTFLASTMMTGAHLPVALE